MQITMCKKKKNNQRCTVVHTYSYFGGEAGAKQYEQGGSESFQRRVRDINKYINIVS